jgi:hypothetical protein
MQLADKGGNWLRSEGDGSNGFCYDVNRVLFRDSAVVDGPLLVTLDTVVLIDIAEHGSTLLDTGKPTHPVNHEHQLELVALANLVELWMLRDIRVVPRSRSLTDFKRRGSVERVAQRRRFLEGLDGR